MQQWIIGILGSIGAIVLASAVAWAGADKAPYTMAYQCSFGVVFSPLACSG